MIHIWLYGHGAMGKLHADKLAHRQDVQLSIIDPAQNRYEPVGRPDGVIIATPAQSHASIALRHLNAGIYCLIEKPLATKMTEAEELAGFDTLCPAFIERFSHQWQAIEPLSPQFIQSERISPFSGRGTDVDVVLDLMIHDIDHCLRLMKDEPTEIRAIGIATRSAHHDMVNARLGFSNGRAAQLSASRVSRASERRFRLFSNTNYVSLDLKNHTVHHIEWEIHDDPKPLIFPINDPLTDMHSAFLNAIAGGEPILISPSEGLKTMRVAMAIERPCAETVCDMHHAFHDRSPFAALGSRLKRLPWSSRSGIIVQTAALQPKEI